jgi:hypothetical protein
MGRLLFMSATDEELRYATGQGMDHVTYILILYRYHVLSIVHSIHFSLKCSLSFLLYGFVVFLINLYSTSGRNATNRRRVTIFDTDGSNMEMISPGGSKWYSRVPSGPQNRGSHPNVISNTHVLGDDDEEEEIIPRMEMLNMTAGRRI